MRLRATLRSLTLASVLSHSDNKRVSGFVPSALPPNLLRFAPQTSDTRIPIGEVPVRVHREVEGTIKQVIIKHYKSGEWYAFICAEEKKAVLKHAIEKVVGLDMGVKFFLSDSDGRQIENPKFYKRTLDRIRIEQRKLSRTKSGSNNRQKQRVKLAKRHQKLRDQRDDFLHKLSKFYVDSYDLVAVEDLNIKGMTRNSHLSQSILDASWSRFFAMLSYKAERAGKIVLKVNPRGTSKEYKYGELDRDYNASLNILERGLLGQGLPFVPLEIEPLRELVTVSASSIVEGGSPLR